MAKSKYAKLVQPLRPGTEADHPSSRGKIVSLVYDGQVQPETKRKSTRKTKSK